MSKRALVSHKLAYPDATALVAQYQSGEAVCEQIVKEYLDRLAIYQREHNGATEIMREQALEEARNPKAGRLSGVPISVKESYSLKGKTVTLGSKIGVHYACEEDAVVIQKMKAEGAIIIARTNLPEFAMMPETDNLLYGKTSNPLNLDKTCGGSSGGEGALVGSGCSVLGLGSDIGGSIRYPASFCGIVGFKPASDAIEKTGTYPYAGGYIESMLSLGPITRSVRDARLVYNIIAKKPLSEEQVAIENLKLFYPQMYRKKLQDTEISEALGNTNALLLQAGLQKSNGDFSDATELIKAYNHLMITELEPQLHASLMGGKKGARYSLTTEAWRQVTGNPSIHYQLFMMLTGMVPLRPSHKKYEQSIQFIDKARQKYNEMLGDDGIWVLPTVGCLAPSHGKMFSQLLTPTIAESMKPTMLCNILNLPCITLPAWRFKNEKTGLVPGVMLVCKEGNEHKLLQVAEWLENKI